MKGGTSRTSRISADGRESFDHSLPGIPDIKWQEFLEKEENDEFLLGLREEIVQQAMEIIFEKYMEKQAVAFTVHCAHLALVKVLNVFYMFKDPGDLEDPKVIESWEPDEEPIPSKVDSWATGCMKVKEPDVSPPAPKVVISPSAKKSSLDLESESLESMSFIADLFEGSEEGYFPMTDRLTSSTSIRKKSIFTRTLSMPRDLLPKVVPQTLVTPCKDWSRVANKSKERRKTS